MFRIRIGTRDFSLLTKRSDKFWGPASHKFSGYWVFFPRGQSGRGAKLTILFHIVPRLRMSGAKALLPLYAFMAWTGKSLLSIFIYSSFLYLLSLFQLRNNVWDYKSFRLCVGLLGHRTGSPHICDLCPCRTTRIRGWHTSTAVPRMGSEPTLWLFERSEISHKRCSQRR